MLMAIIATLSFFGGYFTRMKLHPDKPPVTIVDTIWEWHTDTVKLTQVKPVTKIIERLKIVRDTITRDSLIVLPAEDSVAVEIPIEQRFYEGKNYKAVVQGYRPELVSIDVRQPELPTAKKKWWSVTIGPQVGYGFTPSGWEPYAGVGATVGISF